MTKPMAQQIKQLEKTLRQYANVEVPRATASALNKISPKVKNQLVKTTAKEVKVPGKFLKRQIFTSRAKSKSLSAYVKSYLRPVSAVRLLPTSTLLKARPRGTNRRGVRVAGQQFDGAFINLGSKSGRFYVLRRLGKGRYPIEVIAIKIDRSIDANQLPLAEKFMRADFVRLYKHELQYRIGKYGARA